MAAIIDNKPRKQLHITENSAGLISAVCIGCFLMDTFPILGLRPMASSTLTLEQRQWCGNI